jgi:mRNA interferase RelE/StbE
MAYKIVPTKKFDKQLSKINPHEAKKITKWLTKNLENTSSPRLHGKSLSGPLSPYWRYRIGDFRLLAQIDDNIITIFLIEIEHRRSVYKR